MKKIKLNFDIINNLYCVSGMSMANIATILKFSRPTIKKIIIDNGIKIDSDRKFSNKKIILTKEQEEILFGGLLGDACLTKNGKELTNPQITYTSSVKNHVEYFKSYFNDLSTNECKILKPYKFFDKRTNKEYTRYTFRSILNVGLIDYFNNWYHNGIKVIPLTLKLTPKICLMWYIGDGSIQHDYKNKSTGLIKLSTNFFSKTEIENILIPQLKIFEAYISKTDKNQFVIKIPRRKIKKFLTYIGNCPVKEYEYKWFVFDYKNKKYKNNEN